MIKIENFTESLLKPYNIDTTSLNESFADNEEYRDDLDFWADEEEPTATLDDFVAEKDDGTLYGWKSEFDIYGESCDKKEEALVEEAEEEFEVEEEIVDPYDTLENLWEVLGADTLVAEIAKALSTDQLEDIVNYIARMHDINSLDSVE